MEIRNLILGELQTNCYLVWDQKTKEGIIIDPADEANFISEEILSLGFRPMAIYATHGHFDHILASNELQMAFNIPFFVHEKDLFLLKDLIKNASFWTKRKIIEKPPEKIILLSFRRKPESIQINGIEIIKTPGHTPGSVCFYFPKENILFTGDTLFANGVGRTDFSYGSEEELLASLQKLSKLPSETKIYPGHGEILTLKQTSFFPPC